MLRFPNINTETRFLVGHPADYLVRTLQRIKMERIMVGSSSEASRTPHPGRLNAQVFLLRLFVELVVKASQFDTSRSDALWRPRLESAVTKDFNDLNHFAQEVNDEFTEAVIQRLSKNQAIWQIQYEADQPYDHRLHQLMTRNIQAFWYAKEWVSSNLANHREFLH